jgi:uncharacterized protein YcbX
MSLIVPTNIDTKTGRVTLDAPGQPSLILNSSFHNTCNTVHNSESEQISSDDTAGAWFSKFLNAPCFLKTLTHPSPSVSSKSFANESQFLLISESSVMHSRTLLPPSVTPFDMSCFRSNLVIRSKSLAPFAEDKWVGSTLRIGSQSFKVLDSCKRCGMICVDQKTGTRSSEPFSTIAKYRRQTNQPALFGLHLTHDQTRSKSPFILNVDDPVEIDCPSGTDAAC